MLTGLRIADHERAFGQDFPEALLWRWRFLQLKAAIKGWEEKHKELNEKIKVYQKSQKELEDSVVLKDHNLEVRLLTGPTFFYFFFYWIGKRNISSPGNTFLLGAVWSPGWSGCMWPAERWNQSFSQWWSRHWWVFFLFLSAKIKQPVLCL